MSYRRTFSFSVVVVASIGLLLTLAGLSLRALDYFRERPLSWQGLSESFGSRPFETISFQLGLLLMLVGIGLGLLDLGFWMKRHKGKRFP
jgi:hypothetical protein